MGKIRPRLSIKMNKGWRNYHLYSAAFQGKLKLASMSGTKKAVQFVLSKVDERIRSGRYKKLAPLTAMLRQMEGFGTTPLIRRGGLVRALTTDVINAFEGHVGLLKTVKGKGGEKDFTNIGVLIHDGGRIKITEKMRRAFMRRLGRLATKSGVSLLSNRGSKKNVIRIPRRAFMEEVFEDAAVAARVELIYFVEVKKFARL